MKKYNIKWIYTVVKVIKNTKIVIFAKHEILIIIMFQLNIRKLHYIPRDLFL